MNDRVGAVQDLDGRRGWARIRAVVACLVGVSVFALTAAGLVCIAFAAAARFWSWISGTGFADSPVWDWLPGGAAAFGAFAVAVSFLGAFWYFWWGASPQVLREVGARRLDDGEYDVLFNVVEALSIGIGRSMPDLHVAEELAPNALSVRGRGRRDLVVTTGCSELARDQLEAMCAHELGHLWADDAHWVTSGMVALRRASRFGGVLITLGMALLALAAYAAYEVQAFLWSVALTGLALLALGFVSKSVLRRLERSVRGHADEIADVVAVRLAKNPASLGSVCARLASNDRRVTRTGWRSELMWFEMVESSDPGDSRAGEFNARSHRELLERAVAAYATASVPLPDPVADLVARSGL